MQKEISCPEGAGKACDGAAEVERDPEVLSIRIYKDVLQERGGELRAGPGRGHSSPSHRVSTHAHAGASRTSEGPARAQQVAHAALSSSVSNEAMPAYTRQTAQWRGCCCRVG